MLANRNNETLGNYLRYCNLPIGSSMMLCIFRPTAYWMGEKMTNSIVVIILSFSLLIACAKPDKSILVKEGDELLDCRALANELEFAKKLGENASSRRRHIRALQEKRKCIKKSEITISIGVVGSL